MDPKVVTLISEIETAFQHVRLEGGITLQEARAIDDYQMPEAAELEAWSRDHEERWQDIPEEKLRIFNDVFPFLYPRGYRFYIPAYMVWMLRHLHLNDHDSELSGSTVYSFKVGRPSDPWHNGQLETFELLNLKQKECICRFLRFLDEDGEFSVDVREYLSDYWRVFCKV